MAFSDLSSASWWKAALIRAARTALVVAVPYVPASYAGDVPYLAILLAAALAAITSLLTSLRGLPETNGIPEPWWKATLARVVSSTAQGAIAAFGTSVLLTDVNWQTVGSYALTTGFGSLLLALLQHLPEVPEGEPAPVSGEVTVVVNNPESTAILPTTEIPISGDIPSKPHGE